jgi:hypothetical protein
LRKRDKVLRTLPLRKALCLKMSKYSEEADIEINKTDLAKAIGQGQALSKVT